MNSTPQRYKHAKTEEERAARIRQNKARYKLTAKGQRQVWADTLKRYNLTPEAWDSMFYRQGFSCAICSVHDLDYDNQWHTDHCHATGAVRGILCHHCNLLLGNARDNSHTLSNAIDYLRNTAHGG